MGLWINVKTSPNKTIIFRAFLPIRAKVESSTDNNGGQGVIWQVIGAENQVMLSFAIIMHFIGCTMVQNFIS